MKQWQQKTIALAAASNLESSLVELVELRAWQIYGCANCVNIHPVEARENDSAQAKFAAKAVAAG